MGATSCPGWGVATDVLVSPWQWVTPVLIRHPVIVLFTELRKTEGDVNTFQRMAVKLFVHREQFRLRVPARMVERPAVPGGVGAKDRLVARQTYGSQVKRSLRIDRSADHRE